jgi:galactokinase
MPAARAPGRVTIIGDHTDYNVGRSLPMAIDLATEVDFTPKAGSFLFGIDSDQFPGTPLEIMLGDTAPVRAEAALAAGLLRAQAMASGGVARVTSTLPVGAGLS